MVIDKDKVQKTLAENYRAKYKSHMDFLENNSALSAHRAVSDFDVVGLGKQLDKCEELRALTESAAAAGGFAADLGQLPKKALEIITAAYGTSVIPVLSSVQPIEEEQGIIYYKSIVAKSTRGNMVEGDELFNAALMPEKYPNGFAGAKTKYTQDLAAAQATITINKIATAAAASDKFNNVRPHSVKVYFELGTTGKTGANFEPVAVGQEFYAVDDGAINGAAEGYMLGRDMSGTINYQTSKLELTVGTDAQAWITAQAANYAVRLVVAFEQDFESAGYERIGKIQYELTSKQVQAEVFALTEQLGLLKSYAMQKRFGKDPQDEMMNDLINTLTMDVGGEVLTRLVDGCRMFKPKGAAADYVNHVVYNKKSYQAPILSVQTLGLKLNQAAQKIYNQSGRGTGNIICAAPDACWQIQSLDGFKPSNQSIQGPHVFGTLGDMTVIRVPSRVSGFEDPETCLVVYKGTGDFDAPAVYAPYMPLYVSGSIPMLNNPMMKSGLVCTWSAIQTTNPQFLTEIKFDNSYDPDEQFLGWNSASPKA